MAIERVAVIGAGEWGTALAQAAALAGRHVTLIGRDPEVLAEVNVAHTNRKHLGLLKLSPHISASSRYSGADLVILAVPAQAQGGLVTNPFASNYPSVPIRERVAPKRLSAGTARRPAVRPRSSPARSPSAPWRRSP